MTDDGMADTAVRWERGADGIAVVTLDDPARSANTFNEAYLAGMDEVLDGLAAAHDELRGVIVTSAKKTFFAGADLAALIRLLAPGSRHSCAGWRPSACRWSRR